MKKSLMLAVIIAGLASAPAFAATKTYQVTGPVTDMSADTITVQKGAEKWEIAKGTAGVPADVKVGSKVTVQYTMTAESVVEKPMMPKATKPSASTTGTTGSAMQPAMATAPTGTPTATK